MKRIYEIVIGWGQVALGIILVILGVILAVPFIPGPGVLLIVMGVLLISPYHGKKLIAWGKEKWRKFRKIDN
jgi:hypothetical protein